MRIWMTLLWLALAATPAMAQAAEAPTTTMETIVVSGELPGPGMWKISRGDHVLWILGTLTPLPKRMEWLSSDVEATIAQAQAVLLPPTVKMETKIGVFGTLFLLPTALSARNNPNDARLVDVVPADLYQRWLALKDKYGLRSKAVEKRRPVVAAQKLYERAIKRAGLTLESPVRKVVTKTAKRHKLPITQPKVEVQINDPKAALKQFAATSLDDIDCFSKTLARIETDLQTMTARANAWALGDIEALRELPYTDQNQACADAFLQSSVARERGLDDLRTRLVQAWLASADSTIERHAVSFATLPIAELLRPDGVLTELRARGYQVEAPE